jgi:hypothetical protein
MVELSNADRRVQRMAASEQALSAWERRVLGAKLQGRLAETWQLASGWGQEPAVRSALTVPPVSTVAAPKSAGSAR